MFAVDQACTANIYTHIFNIVCMQKDIYSAKLNLQKLLQSIREIKLYTLEIYPLYGNCKYNLIYWIMCAYYYLLHASHVHCRHRRIYNHMHIIFKASIIMV